MSVKLKLFSLFIILSGSICDTNAQSTSLSKIDKVIDSGVSYEDAIDAFEELLIQYENEKNDLGAYRCALNLGFAYKMVMLYNVSEQYYMQAKEIGEKIDDKFLILNALFELGTMYIDLDDNTKGMGYFHDFHKILNTSNFDRDTLNEPENELISKIYITIGRRHLHNEEIDSAQRFFKLASKKANDLIKADVALSLAELFYLKNQINDSTLFHLDKAYKYTLNNPKLIDFLLKTYHLHAKYLYYSKNAPHQAEELLLKADSLAALHSPPELINNLKLRAEYYVRIKQYDKSTLYYDQLTAITDSLTKMHMIDQIGKFQKLFEFRQQKQALEESKKQVELLGQKENNNRLKVYIASLFLIIASVVIFKMRGDMKKRRALNLLNRKLSQEMIRIKELESEQLKNKIELKNKSLTDFAIDINRKHEFMIDILDRLNKIKRADERDGLLWELILHTKNHLNIDENMKYLWENVQKVNHEFFYKLQERFPDLTKTEKQLCAFIHLNLKDKEIAVIKNIEHGTVRVQKTKMRKKLGIDSKVNLGDFLACI